MKTLLIRSITGLFFVLVVMGSIWYNAISMMLLFLMVNILTLWEFYNLSVKEGIYPQRKFGLLCSVMIFLGFVLYAFGYFVSPKYMMLGIIFPFLIILFELFTSRKRAFMNIAFTILGLVYITIPFIMSVYMGLFPYGNVNMPYDPGLLTGFLIILWANDSFAYLVGSLIGKTPLFPSVSPKKTWEGTVGGAVVAIGITYWFISYWFNALDLFDWIMVAIITVITGNLGDLIESRFKRGLKVKDSGNILPGHGGLLDRFDAFIFAVPFVYLYLIFLANQN